MQRRTRIAALAQSIDPERATAAAARLSPALQRGSTAHAVAVLLSAAYPALAPTLEASPEIARALVDDGTLAARDSTGLAMRIGARVGDLDDVDRVRRELRRAARDERIRIALREILPPALGGADVDVTARELSALADVTMEVALAEATRATTARFGPPRTSSGALGRFVILGMGKLGGEELNAGSDIDLIYFYDTDDGAAEGGASGPITLHDYWSRVARRLTATLEEVTEDGFVWRVDLRLRPEGRSGPLVNSLAAAERYYEDFGRLWERAALLRARPSAGDLGFGDELLAMLSPFIWRRRVDPRVAGEMIQLAQRSRAELSTHADRDRDLKLGPGGIREAEFFVQALQLVWGGKEPRVRARNTLDGLRRLRAKGFVTDREAQEIALGYIALRRAEHAVQVASGIQTHVRPDEPAARTRLARALGFATPEAFEADIKGHMARISARFLSLLPEGASSASRFPSVLAALERSNVDAFIETLARAAGALPEGAPPGSPVPDRWADTARDLLELARHPDALLGARSRESFPHLGETIIEAVLDAADPEQAARYLRVFFA
ncbi:MAG: bifunctional [glutamate--ammonia ligase]-adenylyl-L-tyrosine phosphorylase/[glutamate--ammonia-ligase] adenylyltransferase, partial [Byssovorax sp.]